MTNGILERGSRPLKGESDRRWANPINFNREGADCLIIASDFAIRPETHHPYRHLPFEAKQPPCTSNSPKQLACNMSRL